jgi:hypothetical protein
MSLDETISVKNSSCEWNRSFRVVFVFSLYWHLSNVVIVESNRISFVIVDTSFRSRYGIESSFNDSYNQWNDSIQCKWTVVSVLSNTSKSMLLHLNMNLFGRIFVLFCFSLFRNTYVKLYRILFKNESNSNIYMNVWMVWFSMLNTVSMLSNHWKHLTNIWTYAIENEFLFYVARHMSL